MTAAADAIPLLAGRLPPGVPAQPRVDDPRVRLPRPHVIEIPFPADAPRVAGLRAHDYFGDGSFYLLEAPGVRPPSPRIHASADLVLWV